MPDKLGTAVGQFTSSFKSREWKNGTGFEWSAAARETPDHLGLEPDNQTVKPPFFYRGWHGVVSMRINPWHPFATRRLPEIIFDPRSFVT